MATLQYHDNGYGHAVVWHKYRITVVQAYLALYLEVFTLLEEAYIYIYIIYVCIYIYIHILLYRYVECCSMFAMHDKIQNICT